jgi:hypothetical protein
MKIVYFRNGQQFVQDVPNTLTKQQIDRSVSTLAWYMSIADTDEGAIAEANAAGFVDHGECPPLSDDVTFTYKYS